MNYLGHAYLSFGDAGTLTGNMIADHVKGTKALSAYPEGIAQGIRLHRRIDEFTDKHEAVIGASRFFRKEYGLYAMPVIDTLTDHFLSNDRRLFLTDRHLYDFTQEVFDQLDHNSPYFPEAFAGYFPHMKAYNWLYNYRTEQGIQKSLNGLARRARHMPPADIAFEIFKDNYNELHDYYYGFITDIIAFVKKETFS